VQFLVDASNPIVGRFADTASKAYTATFSSEYARGRAGLAAGRQGIDPRIPTISTEVRVFFNPTLQTPLFMVPGVAAMVLLVVTMIATSMGLAREREMGTLEQVMVTPIKPIALIIGKTTPFVVIGCVDILLVFAIAVWVFNVPVRGSLLLLAFGTLLFIMSTVGIGLFISTVSRNQQQAFLGSFIIMMPAVLLSGVLTPVFNMPFWLKPLAYMNPIKYYVDILRAVLLKAAGFTDVLPDLAALFIFGFGILTLAVLRFGKRIG
jgi:ABC-2 type transport system permease protein